MKRIACLLIAALSVSLLLGGCGQNSDPLAIREFIIGDSIGTVEQRGQRRGRGIRHLHHAAAGHGFPELRGQYHAGGRRVRQRESPCLRADVGGRMVLDLTLEQRDLIIENGSASRSYGFEISLSR